MGERHNLRQPSCPFCRIVEGHGEGCTPRILFQNERVAAFEDHKPAALRHYLVVPLTHVKDITQLQQGAEHHALVAEMVKVGRSLLRRDAQSATSFRHAGASPKIAAASGKITGYLHMMAFDGELVCH
eukprot:SM000019S05091  [mRNA]  locus=s19:882720:883758:- [translate_table: standard]